MINYLLVHSYSGFSLLVSPLEVQNSSRNTATTADWLYKLITGPFTINKLPTPAMKKPTCLLSEHNSVMMTNKNLQSQTFCMTQCYWAITTTTDLDTNMKHFGTKYWWYLIAKDPSADLPEPSKFMKRCQFNCCT